MAFARLRLHLASRQLSRLRRASSTSREISTAMTGLTCRRTLTWRASMRASPRCSSIPSTGRSRRGAPSAIRLTMRSTFPFDSAAITFSGTSTTRSLTRWTIQSRTVPTQPLSPCAPKGDANTAPKLFGCDPKGAYQSFRNAYPGESGMRNVFRLPGIARIDAGLGKSFGMPWSEKQQLQLRVEVFNLTNTQHFGALDLSRSGFGIRLDPKVRNLTPPANWSNFTDIQGGSSEGRRVMQIGARFSF